VTKVKYIYFRKIKRITHIPLVPFSLFFGGGEEKMEKKRIIHASPMKSFYKTLSRIFYKFTLIIMASEASLLICLSTQNRFKLELFEG